MPTLLTEQSDAVHDMGRADGDALWLSAAQLERTTGWTLKPEGFCKGDVCVPVPPARASELVDGGDINVAALWCHLGQPLAHDASGETWVLGSSAAEQSSRLRSLEAPDFELPDLAGQMHSLGRLRGRKVLLVSWASW